MEISDPHVVGVPTGITMPNYLPLKGAGEAKYCPPKRRRGHGPDYYKVDSIKFCKYI